MPSKPDRSLPRRAKGLASWLCTPDGHADFSAIMAIVETSRLEDRTRGGFRPRSGSARDQRTQP
jgi:hypothetical protein